MEKRERNEKIKELRKSMTLQTIGQKFGISRERVRQICHPVQLCLKHKREFRLFCAVCREERRKIKTRTFKEYEIQLSKNLINKEKEIRRLKVYSRKQHLVLERAILVKNLRDSNLSFPQIGKLLHRDHTSIMNLLYKVYPLIPQ